MNFRLKQNPFATIKTKGTIRVSGAGAPRDGRNWWLMSATQTAPATAYEIHFRVEPHEIDEMGHVNNVNYLRWVQDVATAHWRAAATPADQERLLWVVLRHEIDYKTPAKLDDEIVARTWVGAASKLRFERHTEIVRAADAKLLARAVTQWCPVDAKTMRPTDVGDAVRAVFSNQR